MQLQIREWSPQLALDYSIIDANGAMYFIQHQCPTSLKVSRAEKSYHKIVAIKNGWCIGQFALNENQYWEMIERLERVEDTWDDASLIILKCQYMRRTKHHIDWKTEGF